MNQKIYRLVLASAAGLSMTSATAIANSGVYTSTQASQGQNVYENNCASCHGADLQGKIGPALEGSTFHQMANTQNLTGASLLAVTSKSMPKTAPGSLSSDQYDDVTAYILEKNGYPAGDTKLSSSSSKLAALKLASKASGSSPEKDNGQQGNSSQKNNSAQQISSSQQSKEGQGTVGQQSVTGELNSSASAKEQRHPGQQNNAAAQGQSAQSSSSGQPSDAAAQGKPGQQNSSGQKNTSTQGHATESEFAHVAQQATGSGQPAAVGVNVTVSDQMLKHANQDQNDWLLYGRTYDNQRFSPLTQIDTQNVKDLLPSAIIQTGIANTFEDSPIEVNGILYIITASDHVQAYNAVTGKLLWNYTPKLKYSIYCCGPEARGVAVAYGKVFVARLDARLTALDARTGKVDWTTNTAQNLKNPTKYSMTMAPQVYDGMVIVDAAGAEYQIRDFVAAYNAKTGKQEWMFRTTAAPGQPGGKSWSGDSWKTGGGSVWNTPAIDRKNGLVTFAVGNPNPDNWGENRKGNNAYTDSIVAVHVKTGKIAWWYQEVHHDLWDYDADGPVVLLRAKDNGKDVEAAAEAGKEGQVFIVNRQNGKLIRKSQPFVMQSSTMWTVPSSKPVTIYPGANGGGVWSPAAYSTQTHDFYVMGDDEAYEYTGNPLDQKKSGTPQVGEVLGSELKVVNSAHPTHTIPATGTLSAVNVDTGQIDWQYHSNLPMEGGVMATAGNLVFTGEMNGNFDAFNAHTGQKLWHYYLGAGVNAPPITYRVNGTQYVAVAAGGNGNNGNPEMMKKIGRPQYGDTVAIFAIPEALRTAGNQNGNQSGTSNAADDEGNQQTGSDTGNNSGSATVDNGSGRTSGSGVTTIGTGDGSGNSQTGHNKVNVGQPPGGTANEGASNTMSGHQSGSGNQAGGNAGGASGSK